MDNYLKTFSEELDAAFKPEALFRDEKIYIKEWLKRKFIIRKHRKEYEKNQIVLLKLNVFS
jgi:hypothetical protein